MNIDKYIKTQKKHLAKLRRERKAAERAEDRATKRFDKALNHAAKVIEKEKGIVQWEAEMLLGGWN